MKLQASDIQSKLPAHVWQLLTGGVAQVATDAITAARAYLSPRMARSKHTLDEEKNSTHRRAVYLISLYQLYARVEREAVARDKLREGIALLESLYGRGSLGESPNAAGDEGESAEAGTFARKPTSAVVAGATSWRGFA